MKSFKQENQSPPHSLHCQSLHRGQLSRSGRRVDVSDNGDKLGGAWGARIQKRMPVAASFAEEFWTRSEAGRTANPSHVQTAKNTQANFRLVSAAQKNS